MKTSLSLIKADVGSIGGDLKPSIKLKEVGREWKLDRITTDILPENSGMQHVARQAGFECHYEIEDGVVKATMTL